MLRIGLTGGIGSGKSAAAAAFSRLGVPVIDADIIARDVVKPGCPALTDIAAVFGQEVLLSDDSLDRKALRQRIFAEPELRKRLEAILHPRIRESMQQRLDALDAPYAILVIPLLLESGQRDMVDRILVVDTPENLQIQRTSTRDGVSAGDVEAIMAAQCDRDTRLAAADDLLINDDSLEILESRVAALHQRYLAASDT